MFLEYHYFGKPNLKFETNLGYNFVRRLLIYFMKKNIVKKSHACVPLSLQRCVLAIVQYVILLCSSVLHNCLITHEISTKLLNLRMHG
jgi:hypothetical protein